MRKFECPEGHDPTKVYLHIGTMGQEKFVIWDCYLPSDKFWVGEWVLQSVHIPEFRPSTRTLYVWGSKSHMDSEFVPIWRDDRLPQSYYGDRWDKLLQALKDSDKVVLKIGEGERPPTLEEDFFADVV